MPSASGTIVYAALRAIVAVAVVFAAWHGGRSAWPIIGQAVSDTSCLAFLLAYVDSDLRSSLGWLPLPLLLYVIGWEGWGALRAAGSDSDTAADGVGAELLDWLGGVLRALFWVLLRVPPGGGGGVFVLRVLSPRGGGGPRPP